MTDDGTVEIGKGKECFELSGGDGGGEQRTRGGGEGRWKGVRVMWAHEKLRYDSCKSFLSLSAPRLSLFPRLLFLDVWCLMFAPLVTTG